MSLTSRTTPHHFPRSFHLVSYVLRNQLISVSIHVFPFHSTINTFRSMINLYGEISTATTDLLEVFGIMDVSTEDN